MEEQILGLLLRAMIIQAISKENQEPEDEKPDVSERVRNQRMLSDYIRTSLWDEHMNRKREFWLWER
jgi:hypothetical protein